MRTVAHDPSAPITTPQQPDLRSPRKQMFTDLPTPAYHQTAFHSSSSSSPSADNIGMVPMTQPSYGNYQMAPQGEGGFGSLNDALRSQPSNVYSPPAPKDVPPRRRESGMGVLGMASAAHLRAREGQEGGSF